MKKATGNNGRIKENFLSSMVEIFELPAEVILDLPLVTLIGDNRLKIENYLSVTEYSYDMIKINTVCGIMKICGSEIRIKQIAEDGIELRGNISSIEYEK